ncbi:MAG: TetR/AcrR family transcriptional regulator [Deltaproteobacteria bacterium]|nr:TetR/AcrR family transcriptional regulator [Deltaproteobacteria bacterium]
MEERLPRDKDPDSEARGRLLAAATDLFARKGYAATAVREIVAAAGVSPPVLYYHFGNKEGLFLELMREAWGDFESTVDAALGETGSARDRLLRLASQVVDLFRAHVGVARVMNSIYYGPPQGAPAFDFDSCHTKFRQAILGLVQEGVSGGEFRPGQVGDMAWAIIGAINIAMEIELCHPELSLGPEGLLRVLHLIFRGIEAPRVGPEEEAL